MDLLIPYGDLKGELVSPGDIRLRRGKNCGAVCPDINCKKPLTLRDSGRTVTHFAHPPSETGEYSCNGETALHQRMKEIFASKKSWIFSFHEHPKLPFLPDAFYKIEDTRIEYHDKKTNRYMDVVWGVNTGKQKIYIAIEIYVTNRKDNEYIKQMRELNRYIIEVDAKKFVENGGEPNFLCAFKESSNWLYYPRTKRGNDIDPNDLICPECGGEKTKKALKCAECAGFRCECGNRKMPEYDFCYECNSANWENY